MLIVRKTDAGAYVELASSDPILEQVDVTYDVPKEVLEDGEVLASTVPAASTAVLRHDWNWARAADGEILAALGYWKLNQVDAPPGKRQVGYTIEDRDGAPVLVPVYEDLPAPPLPEPPGRRTVRKLLVVDRIIEAGAADAALAGFAADPVAKLRFDAATDLWADDESVIAFLTAIGLNAEQILAPG